MHPCLQQSTARCQQYIRVYSNQLLAVNNISVFTAINCSLSTIYPCLQQSTARCQQYIRVYSNQLLAVEQYIRVYSNQLLAVNNITVFTAINCSLSTIYPCLQQSTTRCQQYIRVYRNQLLAIMHVHVYKCCNGRVQCLKMYMYMK